MTFPAASGPVCPSVSTTRVEATFNDKRSIVLTSNTVGNTIKSSGLTVYKLVSKTIMDRAILKLKKISSKNGGSGNIIIANIVTMMIGATNAAPPAPISHAGNLNPFMAIPHSVMI